MAAAQVRLGQFLEKHTMQSTVKVSDELWLDSKHTPSDIPYKVNANWFGHLKRYTLEMLRSSGLDLPETFLR